MWYHDNHIIIGTMAEEEKWDDGREETKEHLDKIEISTGMPEVEEVFSIQFRHQLNET